MCICVLDNNVIQESHKKGICRDKTQVNTTQQGRKRLISPGSAESTSPEEDTGKKCRNADQKESIISSKVILLKNLLPDFLH